MHKMSLFTYPLPTLCSILCLFYLQFLTDFCCVLLARKTHQQVALLDGCAIIYNKCLWGK